ncbi:hypothetical protein HMN09_00041900 [Mycena chlorophos]|uniref:Uncharacterized protein n=1 Tax=Mycena chlorophos TaxID=658473 RepID=A0A8H6WL38_MYCCL|nr:hypothetical protein HMN09_00041900 [Mycena chlorophos]
MLANAAGAAGSWLEVFWTTMHTMPARAKAGIFIQGAVFSFIFLLSFFGLISAAKGQRGAVYIYSKFLFITTPLIILALLVTLFTTLHPESNNVDQCINGSSSDIIRQFCTQDGLTSLVKILPVALLGSSLLLQFYGWIIAISYGEERDVADFGSRFDKYYNNSGSDVETGYPEPPFARR